MKLSLIVAMAENGIIGRNNQLPWHLPEDLKYFKTTTMGKPIIMGRKTFESIGKPLPGRTNIVITRQTNPDLPETVKVAASLEQAVDLAENICLIDGAEEVMVIGGEQIYALAMPQADRLYLTKVHAPVEGDASFTYDEDQWILANEVKHAASENNPYDYSFCLFEKKQ